MKDTSMKIYMIQKISSSSNSNEKGNFESGNYFLFRNRGKVWYRRQDAAAHIKARIRGNRRNEVNEYKECALVEIELHFNRHAFNEVLQMGALVVKKYRIVYDGTLRFRSVTFEPMF